MVGGPNVDVGGSSEYAPGLNGDVWAGSSRRSERRVPIACKLRNLRTHLDTAPGGSTSRTWAWDKNGSAFASTTWTGTDVGFKEDTTEATLAADDEVEAHHTTAGGTPAAGYTSWAGEVEVEGDAITAFQAFGTSNSPGAGPTYAVLAGFGDDFFGFPEGRGVQAVAKTIIGIYVWGNDPGSGNEKTFQLYKSAAGGTPTAVSGTDFALTNGNTKASATGLAVSVSPGELVALRQITSAGSPSGAGGYQWAYVYEADTAGECELNGATIFNSIAGDTTTRYHGFGINRRGWQTSKAINDSPAAPAISESVIFSDLYTELDAGPGAGDTRTFTVMDDTSATSLATVHSGAGDTDAADTSDSATMAKTDLLSLRSEATGTPDTADLAWAMVCTYPNVEAYEIAGDVTIVLTPAATMIEGRTIAGSVPLALTPAAAMVEGRVLAGAVPLALLPAATMLEGRTLAGSVPLALAVAAAMEHTSGDAITGDVTIELTPASTMIEGRVLAGAVPLALTPAAAMVEGRTLAGSVPLALTPAAAMLEGRAIAGDVTVAFAVAATMIEGRAAAGDVTLTLTPAAGMVEGRTLLGDVTLALSVAAALNFDPTIVGNVTLVLLPASGMLEGRAFVGSVPLALAVAATMTYQADAIARYIIGRGRWAPIAVGSGAWRPTATGRGRWSPTMTGEGRYG